MRFGNLGRIAQSPDSWSPMHRQMFIHRYSTVAAVCAIELFDRWIRSDASGPNHRPGMNALRPVEFGEVGAGGGDLRVQADFNAVPPQFGRCELRQVPAQLRENSANPLSVKYFQPQTLTVNQPTPVQRHAVQGAILQLSQKSHFWPGKVERCVLELPKV